MSQRILSGTLGVLTLVLFGMLSAQYFRGQRAEAQGNQAPVILNPTANVTVTEGDVLTIPFAVREPDNDTVQYVVEYIANRQVQQALPSGATLERDLNTTQWRLVWWPASGQADQYTFRFRATDSAGNQATKDVTVTVTKRDQTPGILVRWVKPDAEYKRDQWYAVPSGFQAVIQEGEVFLLSVHVMDPTGESPTFEVDGFPNAQVSRDDRDPNRYSVRGQTRLTPGVHRDVGSFDVTLTVKNTRGGVTTFTLRAVVLRSWERREYLYAVPNKGITNDAQPYMFNSAVVRGSEVPLHFDMVNAGGGGDKIPVDGLTVQYRIDDISVSPLVGNSAPFIWDSNTVADGSHTLSARVVNGPEPDRYRTLYATIIVDNVSGPVKERQTIPLVGYRDDDKIDPSAWDAVSMPYQPSHPHEYDPSHRHPTEHAMVRPYPYQPVPSARNLPDSSKLLDPSQWFIEPLIHAVSGLYRAQPTLYVTRDKHLISGSFSPRAGITSDDAAAHAEFHDHFDGGRNDNNVCPYSTFIANPKNTGWIGIDISGRVFLVLSDGSVRTIAGWRSKPVIPYHYKDTTIGIEGFRSYQKELVGDFENGVIFKVPNDIAADPRNSRVLYVADTANHRIAKIEFSDDAWSRPVITTYAGVSGSAGYRDGPASQALFDNPYSIAVRSDGTMYVADRSNSAIRKITPDGTVTTAIRQGVNAPPAPSTRTLLDSQAERNRFMKTVPFDEATIIYPQVIRLDSHDNIVFSSDILDTVQRVNFETQIVEFLYDLSSTPGKWRWLEVDRKENIGPVDDILLSLSSGGGVSGGPKGNQQVLRLSSDGKRVAHVSPIQVHGGPHTGLAGTTFEPQTHYPWAIAIDDNESRFITTGFGSKGIASFRMRQPQDPTKIDSAYGRGEQVWSLGTVPGFPWGSRPAFSALHGQRGHGQLGGSLPNFDDLTELSDRDLARYIRDGMGGSVPRPEISADSLRDVIYFIRRESLRGHLEEVDSAAIRADLIATGLYGAMGPDDALAPEIRNPLVERLSDNTFRISWKTDEVTTGIVEYGAVPYYLNLFSKMQGEGKEFSVTVTDTLTQPFVRVRVKDVAGNFMITPMMRPPGAPEDTKPPVISNVKVQAITATTAQVTWKTDKAADSRVEYGETTGYGFLKSDSALVLAHNLLMTGLKPETTYHFRVRSKDSNANVAISSDSVFQTLKAPPNQPPTVDAGKDSAVTMPASVALDARVSDDSLPVPPGKTVLQWTKVSGPGSVTFGNSAQEDTSASFSVPGTYVLRLEANDSVLSASDDVEITVHPKGGKGLVGHWKLDGDAMDTSSERHHGQVRGGATFTAGKLGQAISLDGNDDWVQINLSQNGITDDVTVSAWFWLSRNTALRRVFDLAQETKSGLNVVLKDNRVCLDNIGPPKELCYEMTTNDGQWHHVVAVRNGTTHALSVDGMERQSAGNGYVFTHTRMALGAGVDSSLFFAGLLDDICIFDSALSPSDIAKLYNSGNGLPCDQLNPPPPGPGDLCLQIESDVRKRAGKDQAFSAVKVLLRKEGTAEVLLEKNYSSNAEGKITIPASDLPSTFQDDGMTSFTIGAKIRLHLRTVLKGQKAFRRKGGCDLSLPRAPFGDIDGNGRIEVSDLVSFIRFYKQVVFDRERSDAALLEMFGGRPPFRELIHAIRFLGRVEE